MFDVGDDDDSSTSLASSDEALLDMLGLPSLKGIVIDADECNDDYEQKQMFGRFQTISTCNAASSPLPSLADDWLDFVLAPVAKSQYPKEAVFQFPEECSIPAKHMRILTEEVVRGRSGPNNTLHQADRTYEGIKIWKDGEILERKTLTRLENFVDAHPGWSELCHGYLRRILSAALGIEMVLFKEKLNLKPPGGR